MNLASRTPLFAFALAASLAAPLAFAAPPAATADADTQASAATPATPATPPTDGTAATPATPASASDTSGKMSWNDLDSDKNGNLSKTEAQTVPALVALFDKADANADGQLSGDEYRAYVSKSQGVGQDQGTGDTKADTSDDNDGAK